LLGIILVRKGFFSITGYFTFTAALLAKSDGAEPYILVLTSDTGIENPEITQHVKEESKKIKEYAKKYNLKLEHHIASPLLNDTWAVQVISGRSLPSFSSTNSDCTIDFDILPGLKAGDSYGAQAWH